MGFSLTGTHAIFFIASVIVAGAVSGVFMAVTTDISTSLSNRGSRLQEQLDTEFKIISDSSNIPISGSYYIFYLKNTGGKMIVTTNETFQIFVDGDIVDTVNYNFSDNSIHVEEVARIYVATSEISSGDHKLRIVGPQAIEDEFAFEI